MGYQGNVAYDADTWSAGAYTFAYPQEDARPSSVQRPHFGVIEGRGLDAKVREGVGFAFLNKIKLIVSVVVICAAIGFARVGLLSAQVVLLQQNARMSAAIDQAELHNNELKVERSILSNSSRIGRIATQSYGMVLPEQVDTINLDSDSSSTED